MGDDERLLGSG